MPHRAGTETLRPADGAPVSRVKVLRAGHRDRLPGRDPAFELGCTRPGRCGPTRSDPVRLRYPSPIPRSRSADAQPPWAPGPHGPRREPGPRRVGGLPPAGLRDLLPTRPQPGPGCWPGFVPARTLTIRSIRHPLVRIRPPAGSGDRSTASGVRRHCRPRARRTPRATRVLRVRGGVVRSPRC